VAADKFSLISRSLSRPTKAMRVLRNEGLVALASRSAEVVRPHVYLNESHIWYSLDLTSLPALPPFPAGLELVRGTEEQLILLDQLDTINSSSGRARLSQGATWWCVLEGARPLFSCWVFSTMVPVAAAPSGWLLLPTGSVVLEDSVAAPAARGRGIAPVAWRHVAASATGWAAVMYTKVAVTNEPSRKAVVKAGFREIAEQRYVRIGPVRRRWLRRASDDAAWLAKGLRERASGR
jgi:hypothetical protein